MRLHALTVEAFGPFVGPQHVDFDDLGSAGLFLVHGPTGAGKTSVLDAVCFALFSDVPGARASRGLRADLAAADRPTAVTLEFSSAGRRFRVARSPEYVRPSRRGTGMTKAPARVVLDERIDGAWAVRSTRIDEAADLIKDVVGMGLAQFQRVALLPQGQFADFLRAEPRDRHQLLTALFDVATYEDVETWLADVRRSHTEQVTALTLELDYRVRALADLCSGLPGADGDDPPGGDRSTLTATAVEQWATLGPELLARLEAAATQALGDAEHAASHAMQCQSRHDEAVQIARQVRRGADATAALAALVTRSEQIDRARNRLHQATLAGELRGELASLVTAEQARARAASQADSAAQALAQVLVRPVTTGEIARLAAQEPELGTQLDGIRTALADARTARRTRDEAVARLAEAQARNAHSTSRLAAAAERHTVRADEQARQRALADDLLPAQASHAQATRVHALVTDLIRCFGALDVIVPDLLTAREAHVQAREELVCQQERRLSDLAAELATRLTPDSPCPVCGSGVHPQPAPPATGWSPEDLAATEAAVDAAAARVGGLDRERHATEAIRDRLLTDLASELEAPPPAGIGPWQAMLIAQATTLRQLSTRAAAAADAAATLPALEAQVASDQQEAERLALAAARAEASLADAQSAADSAAVHLNVAIDQLGDAVADHARGCPCRPGGDGPAAATDRAVAVLTAHQRYAAALHEAHSAEGAATSTADALATAAAAFALALASSGFGDRASLEAALLPAADCARLQTQITAHDQQVAINRATLDDPEVAAALAGPQATNPEMTGAALTTAREAAMSTDRARHDTERIAHAARAAVNAVLEGAASVTDARGESARVAALADLAGGTSPDNTLRMRLSTFVLASRLERVVDLANERLRLMGDGRFQLEHDDSLAGRGARSGLGLRIRDAWSGTTRAPSSLSGGESFIASLALALGLADALRESVGGIELQTLFIDEGFGALDEASLDDVLGVLDALRDGGRAVGVVSHVPELRDRIPAQLTVTKSPQGSTLATTTTLAATA